MMNKRKMPPLPQIKWSRRGSVNLYRNRKLPLGEMSLFKGWTSEVPGDPYPVLSRVGAPDERVGGGSYRVKLKAGESVMRLICAHFPFATYEIEFSRLCGASVALTLAGGPLCEVTFDGKQVTVLTEEGKHSFSTEPITCGTLAVTFRPGGVSAYLRTDGTDAPICDVDAPTLSLYRSEEVIHRAKACLSICSAAGGEFELSRAEAFISAGISQADLRPIRYETGEPLIEGGRIFLTASARCEKLRYQVVLSMCPTLFDLRLEGAMFYSYDDGYIHGDVAPTVIYDRTAGAWRLWVWSLAHGHRLAYSEGFSDPRYGISIIDATLMPLAPAGADIETPLAFEGDEDPEIMLVDGVWHFAVCRHDLDGKYHYFHFTSDRPDGGFTYVDKTLGGEKTGASFVKTPEGVYFVCGSDFNKSSVYDIYPLNDFSAPASPKVDFPDGGFRGWGSMILVPCGSRHKYIWITFDRHGGSSFRWSYGNIYVFESESYPIN